MQSQIIFSAVNGDGDDYSILKLCNQSQSVDAAQKGVRTVDGGVK